MSKEIFKQNEELEDRFKEWQKWSDADHLVKSDDGTAGVAVYNGVLCWYNDGWSGYAIDTEQNRVIAISQWEEAIKEIEEFEFEDVE